jgi:sialate O-acetylesterase
MIRDWRQRFKQGDFPFYYVQLANFMARGAEPRDTAWAELREAQTLTLKLPNTGMATAVDIGDPYNIHPHDKRTVGYRLAGIALRRIHARDITEYGPLYRRAQFYGSTATVEFSFADGLRTRGGRPVGFAVAGPDRKFVWADATLDGNRVIVTSPQVPQIVAVRYGWDDNPAINVENAAGLPMFPFRTDRWPGITNKAK